MDLSTEIDAVYEKAISLAQRHAESPLQPHLLEEALQELHFVVEELQTSQEELRHQNIELIATQRTVELERRRYESLFELAPDGYLVTDRQGKIYNANRAAAQLFATSQEYLIDKPLRLLIHESDRLRFQTRLINLNQAHLQAGQAGTAPGDKVTRDWEILLTPHQGEVRSASISVIQVAGGADEDDALLWLLRDITDRQHIKQLLQSAHDQLEQRVAERTLQLTSTTVQLQQKVDEYHRAEQKIREQAALIDIASDAIFVQDLNQQIQFWNKGAERLYGWQAQEVQGKNAHDLLHPVSCPQMAIGMQKTIEVGYWQEELTQITQTQQVIIVASRWTLVRDELDIPKSVLVVNTDITEKKQLESQVYRGQRIEMLGTLANGIAHDLNNIFTPILGLTQLMLLKPENFGLNDQGQKMLKVIVDSTKQGSDLVKQILTFARGTTGQQVPLQSGQILLEVIQIVQQTFSRSIIIHQDIPISTLSMVKADSSQLYQVFMNLCINARDAMAEGGTLTITAENLILDANTVSQFPLRQPGNYVVTTISDTGCGIPPKILEQIFEPFFTTKDHGQGNGLGLSTVLRITENHGGFVKVQSEIGEGSTFRVYLPAIDNYIPDAQA